VIDFFRHLINFKFDSSQFLYLLIVNKPFVMKLSYYITIAFEIFIDIAVISAFILYFLDRSNNLNTQLRMIIGWIIIFAGMSI